MVEQGSHSDWKTLEKWEGIFQSGKSQGIFNRLEKVRENHIKYWKTWGIWDKYYLIFLVIFKWTVYYLPKWIKFSVKKKQNIKKILEKWKKVLEKSGNFVSPKKWEPCRGEVKDEQRYITKTDLQNSICGKYIYHRRQKKNNVNWCQNISLQLVLNLWSFFKINFSISYLKLCFMPKYSTTASTYSLIIFWLISIFLNLMLCNT